LRRNDFGGSFSNPSDDGGFDEFREFFPSFAFNSAFSTSISTTRVSSCSSRCFRNPTTATSSS
jgi:hypothetical protein